MFGRKKSVSTNYIYSNELWGCEENEFRSHVFEQIPPLSGADKVGLRPQLHKDNIPRDIAKDMALQWEARNRVLKELKKKFGGRRKPPKAKPGRRRAQPKVRL